MKLKYNPRIPIQSIHKTRGYSYHFGTTLKSTGRPKGYFQFALTYMYVENMLNANNNSRHNWPMKHSHKMDNHRFDINNYDFIFPAKFNNLEHCRAYLSTLVHCSLFQTLTVIGVLLLVYELSHEK